MRYVLMRHRRRLIRADIAARASIFDPLHRARNAALVCRWTGIRATAIDRPAAWQQGIGRGEAAILCQFAETWVKIQVA